MPSRNRTDDLCEPELRPWGQLIRFRDPAVGPVSQRGENKGEPIFSVVHLLVDRVVSP